MQHWTTRFKIFMGWNLPKRRLDLDFDLLPPNRRGRKPRISGLALRALRKQRDTSRTLLLEEQLEELNALNRRAHWAARRLTLTGLALRAFYPVAVELLARYSKAAGVPDAPEREASLDLAAQVTRALASSYKHLYQHLYDQSRFMYARSRKRHYRVACRILELIRLEQRLLGLRYRQLPARAWQDANTLFSVLASYESVDFQVPGLDSDLRKGGTTRLTDPHRLYTAIQTFALLDHTTWPAEQHGFIDSYRESLDSPVTVTLDGAAKGPDVLYAATYHGGPPRVATAPQDAGNTISIDCGILARSIRSDYKAMLQAKDDSTNFHVPPLLAPLQEVYRISIASLMNRNIKKKMRWQDIDRPGEPMRGMHMYVGFSDIEAHLRGIFSQDSQYQEKRRLADSLADRSALFGEDHTATEESLWQVLYSDQSRFGLQTQETQYTTAMGIGSLLAYGVGSEDRQRPRLGLVSRILRNRPGHVLLEITRLARFAEPVTIRKDLRAVSEEERRKEDDGPIDSLVVYDGRFGWGLLVPNETNIWQKSPVVMQRDGHQLRFRLGGVKAVTQYFILFVLPPQFQGLDEPEYPSLQQVIPQAPVESLQLALE